MKNYDNSDYENYNSEEYDSYNDSDYGNYDNSGYGQFNGNGQPIIQLTDRQKKFASNAFGCIGALFTAPFLLAGIVFFILGAKEFFALNSAKKVCTYKVIGTVSEIQRWDDTHRKSSDDEPTNTYAPVFVYEYQGNKYREEGNYYSPSTGFTVGQSVDIYIDPLDPENVYIPSYKQKKSGSGMSMVIGAICIAVGLIIPISMKRKTKKALTISIPDQYY